MRSLIPVLGAVQWVAGIALSLILVRRSRRYPPLGAVPRFFARVACWLFVLGAVLLVLSATPAAHLSERLAQIGFPPVDVTTVTRSYSIAWGLVAFAGAWNFVLGVSNRRRTAAAELKRRTDRALSHREGPWGPF